MSTNQHPNISKTVFRRLAVGVPVVFALMVALAGRLDWIAGWVFLGSYLVIGLAMTAWMLRRDPDLLVERMASVRRKDAETAGDQRIVDLLRWLFLALFVICSLDGGRFQWSTVPFTAQASGFALFIAAMFLTTWVLHTNSFASAVVRIQTDRGHQVISDGPYRFVRHPMYVAIVIMSIAMPLALASYYGLIPGALTIALIVYRTRLEDRKLHHELDGYTTYAQRVRHRLLPGVW